MIYPSSSAIARDFAEFAVNGRRSDAQNAINDLVRALEKLYDVTGKTNYLDDTVAGLLDECSNIQAGLDADLDGAGVDPSVPEPLDVIEVQVLLLKIRGA